MDTSSKREIVAVVEIPNAESFEAMANRLEMAIDGINFKKEETGRFEEVPAFIGKDLNSSAKFILFGIPEGEFGDAYTLEMSVETDLPIHEFKKSTIEFLSSFISEKIVNSRGYLDYSDELANALTMKGITASKPSL